MGSLWFRGLNPERQGRRLVLQRAPATGSRITPIGKIYYEAMRGRWSRILLRDPSGTAVVNITPVGGDMGDWRTVSPVVIRKHHMTFHPNDLLLQALPSEIREWVSERIGEE